MDYNTTAYDSSAAAASGGFPAGIMLFDAVLIVFALVAMWKVYQKAGKPGWAAIVPFYNVYVMLQIIGRPGWWLLLFLVPGVNIVVAVITSIDMAKSFGRSSAFGVVALCLFSIVGYAILAFGKDKYVGPSAPGPAAPAPTPAAGA